MGFLLRVVVKALLIFVVANLAFAAVDLGALGRVSGYNGVFPGRPRFPFGENPREAYNFSLFNLEAMFASHEIAAPKPDDEFRVVLIGDSSVWGTLLMPEETLAGQLNAAALVAGDGRKVRFYNLGYPTLSLTKDLMILERARQYRPDLVIWLVTLEAFPPDKQLAVPLVENNPAVAQELVQRYTLALDVSGLSQPGVFSQSLIGQRKNLADMVRLQVYGMMWAATGIDQYYPKDYPRAQIDLEADHTFHGKETLTPEDLAFDVLAAGHKGLGEIPLLVVNEPILVSGGKNSEIRYNFYYPRWAYDQYRQWLGQAAQRAGYAYVDAWDVIPPQDFTNSAIHLNERATGSLAQVIIEKVKQMMP